MVQAKILSSLDKLLPDANIITFKKLGKISALRGERLSFQLAFRESNAAAGYRVWYKIAIEGNIPGSHEVRLVDFIPSQMPIYPNRAWGEGFISTEPGLYPDLLRPLPCDGCVPVCSFQTRTAWITIEIPEAQTAGDYELTFTLRHPDTDELVASDVLTVKVLDATLPAQNLLYTQWFHCDCLADYYGVEVFSERHWEIIESFMATAVKNGINVILTPLFTPPLDTMVGGERRTVQLVDVKLEGGVYNFGYDRLDRWIDMCDRLGVRYFEINHFFTQWGAGHAPKVIAEVDGESRRIFGWETQADGKKYSTFLRTFIPDFLAHMKARGDDKRCIFHISDEPSTKHIDQYSRSRAVIADLLEDYMTMDALSHIEFWRDGFVKTPVVSNNNIEPFIEAKVPGLWTYYCCSQGLDVSNRFFAMPGARTRAIGMQMFKYNIAGFLQWGYNFYMNQYSRNMIDPYADSTGDYFFPSGDGYSVYPAQDGRALESMRIVQFHEAIQDIRAMELCESLVGHDKVVETMEKIWGEIKFSRCPTESAVMLAIRESVNALIEENIFNQQ